MNGSTTLSAADVATAASKALPPLASIRAPAWAASGCAAATTPWTDEMVGRLPCMKENPPEFEIEVMLRRPCQHATTMSRHLQSLEYSALGKDLVLTVAPQIGQHLLLRIDGVVEAVQPQLQHAGNDIVLAVPEEVAELP